MAKAERIGLVKTFKLSKPITLTNMVLFDSQGVLKKYTSVQEILQEFYTLRLNLYTKRRASLLDRLQEEIKALSNKSRFILAVVHDEFHIRNVSKRIILQALQDQGYDMIVGRKGPHSISKRGQQQQQTEDPNPEDPIQEEGLEEESDEGVDERAEIPEGKGTQGRVARGGKAERADPQKLHFATLRKGYTYLVDLPLWTLTMEEVDKIKKETGDKISTHATLEAKTEKDLWREDLQTFLGLWSRHQEELADLLRNSEEDERQSKLRMREDPKARRKLPKGSQSRKILITPKLKQQRDKAKSKAKAKASPKAKGLKGKASGRAKAKSKAVKRNQLDVVPLAHTAKRRR